jgi:hypothetical protein
MAERPTSYREFWPYYLREHADPRSRALHYAGSLLALTARGRFAAGGSWLWLAAAALSGYGFAWAGHFAFEGNRPATFAFPIWSLASDYRMLALFLAGRLGRHLDRAGVGLGQPPG